MTGEHTQLKRVNTTHTHRQTGSSRERTRKYAAAAAFVREVVVWENFPYISYGCVVAVACSNV